MKRYRGRHPGKAVLLSLDGNPTFADVNLNASRFLALFVEIITQDQGGDNERADNEVEKVAIHDRATTIPIYTHERLRGEVWVRSDSFPFLGPTPSVDTSAVSLIDYNQVRLPDVASRLGYLSRKCQNRSKNGPDDTMRNRAAMEVAG